MGVRWGGGIYPLPHNVDKENRDRAEVYEFDGSIIVGSTWAFVFFCFSFSPSVYNIYIYIYMYDSDI